jgi:hypothetical protein
MQYKEERTRKENCEGPYRWAEDARRLQRTSFPCFPWERLYGAVGSCYNHEHIRLRAAYQATCKLFSHSGEGTFAATGSAMLKLPDEIRPELMTLAFNQGELFSL